MDFSHQNLCFIAELNKRAPPARLYRTIPKEISKGIVTLANKSYSSQDKKL